MSDSEDRDDAVEVDLTGIARRLARIGHDVRPRPDGLLGLVAALGRTGPGVGIGLIADGVLMYGAIGSSDAFANVLSEASRDALEPYDFGGEVRDLVVNAPIRFVEGRDSYIKECREVLESYPEDARLDDIALEDVLKYLAATDDPAILDLHDVKVFYSGDEPMDVSHVRVQASAVTSWWPLVAQGVKVNYVNTPPGDPEGSSN